jgi:hypothetical protein
MRSLLIGVALVCAAPALAQTPQYIATVTANDVAIRGGPAETFAETGTLVRGASVIVHHEAENGWLAIQAPAGSLSWVNFAFVRVINSGEDYPRNGVIDVDTGTVTLSAGKYGLNNPLNVQRTTIPNGTIVQVVGTKVKLAESGVSWYPIVPPNDDFRYIPKSAVRIEKQASPAQYVVRSSKSEPAPSGSGTPSFQPIAASVPNRPTSTVKPANWPNHPLWQQAEQSARNGDYTRAENLYLKLAAEMNQAGGDAELANLCYARVHAVREKQRGQRASQSAAASRTGEQWTGPGVLRVAGFRLSNRPTFALVGSKGEVMCYAVAGPGVELERYRGYEVELFGPLTHPGDLRGAGVMTATKARLARDR